jgi:hypothetical protein
MYQGHASVCTDSSVVCICATAHCIVSYLFMKDVEFCLIVITNLLVSGDDSVTTNEGMKKNT